MLTTGAPAATKYLGDQLNPGGTWHIQFEVGQASWYQTDAEIGSDNMDDATWTWRTANWFADGTGSNKQVQADFGNFRFTQPGYWYMAGRAKGEAADDFHYANSTAWENTGTLTPLYYFQVDAINGVADAMAQQNSTNPSTEIDLTWTRNAQSNNVMIVRKKIYQSWTEPTQGTAYTVDATIGTGVVVYNSNGESFTNIGLASSTDYDYKFYSVNNNYYSEGIHNTIKPINTAFALGDGTIGNPFQVANADALNCVRHYITSVSMAEGNFIQTADIDLGVYAAGEGWLPIDELKGSYNGQGHTISNLTINRPTDGYVGLFATVSTGIISNLGLINVNIIGCVNVGSFAATMSMGITPTTVQMAKCYATGAVSIVSGGLGMFIGGLVGHLCAPISRCYSTCTVTNNSPNQWQNVGGLVGALDGSFNIITITNCYATGAVNAASNNFTQYLGGLVGWANGEVSIQNSFATGHITYELSIFTWVSGLVGRYDYDANSSGSFFDMETTGQLYSMLSDHGKTTAEMKSVGTYLAYDWDFSSTGEWAINGTTNSGYPYLRFQGPASDYIWLGTSSATWATPGNWTENAAPTSGKGVIIPNVTNDPIISTTTAITKLTVETGGVLTIANTGALTVSGTLTNNATETGLVIQSDATGTGSLIHNTDDVPATVNVHITGSTNLNANVFHFVSIPAQVASPTAGLFLNSYLYQLDASQQEATNNNYYGKWVGMGTSTETPLNLNQGYMEYWPSDVAGTNIFSGNLNNGDFSCALTGHTGTYTFNLVPNPYPSAVNWGEGTGWTKSAGIGGTCYVWGSNAGNYQYIPLSGGSGIIPVGQAFIVLVDNEASPSLTMNNAARVHSAQAFYKSTGEISNQLSVRADANGYTDVTRIAFNAEGTDDFDLQTDGMKMFGLQDAPQLYTLSANQKYSINSLPELNGYKSVPMNFETSFNGGATLAFME